MGAWLTALVCPFQGLLEKAALEIVEGSVPWKSEHSGLTTFVADADFQECLWFGLKRSK